MNLNARIILAVRNFFRKYGRVILIVAVIWLIIFLFNQYLKNRPREKSLINTYTPDEPIMDEGDTVPKRAVSTVNETIEKYFNYCNQKEYENAFNMLTDQCKEYLYANDVNKFKEYVDKIFPNNKIYNIQNYSNVDDIYIYNIRILDDITATGTTENYDVYQEKIVLHGDNSEFKISNQGYIGNQKINKEIENDDMKIKMIKKEMSYTKEEYTLEIRNKTDNYMMICDEMGGNQITLNLGNQIRPVLNVTNGNIIIVPDETKKVTLIFDKYYDDGVSPIGINFNNVRLLKRIASSLTDVSDQSEDNIVRTFSINIGLQ